jgi:hypothetical protein
MAARRTSISMVGEDAGEIAEDVETACPCHDLFDHFDDGGFLGDVALDESCCGFAMLFLDLVFDAGGA